MKALKAALESGRLDAVYLFHGTDDFLKEEKVRALVARATDPSTRDFNLEQLRGTECDAARLSGALEALPMLAERRVVVLRDPDALKKPAAQRLERYLGKPASDTCLVLVIPSGTKPDADHLRAASAVEFRSLNEDELLQWLALHDDRP
jgi:DNA polymerase-3 subunit delta